MVGAIVALPMADVTVSLEELTLLLTYHGWCDRSPGFACSISTTVVFLKLFIVGGVQSSWG